VEGIFNHSTKQGQKKLNFERTNKIQFFWEKIKHFVVNMYQKVFEVSVL